MMALDPWFYEIFANMQRLGPGSIESTKRAMAIYPHKNELIQILDVGCGVGTPTFLLVEIECFIKAQEHGYGCALKEIKR
ncbi:MAG: hypothetical protein ACOH15_10350 [Acetobacterium sp.]